MTGETWTIRGRVWLFGSDLNTDLMMPGAVLFDTEEAQTRALFSGHRPGWADQVRPGDIVVAGRNFGCGSSRPAARSFANLGVACIVADGINSLFLRGCVSYGMPALACPGISGAVAEGDVVTLWPCEARVELLGGAVLKAVSLPADLLRTMRAGGILPALEQRGLISPSGTQG
ncbi:3-isopropylmalate dehydratase [Poseidonocella sp. HB161398]|uniref:3-isopropylmalate dehydratase n=1 Tax=Poseidonocella sp. HB161398 TaxID=2320855 RepID=UPI0011094AEB|nr:3-isopropylmalate dehydratase [Poseidonocella sp. HB161398]